MAHIAPIVAFFLVFFHVCVEMSPPLTSEPAYLTGETAGVRMSNHVILQLHVEEKAALADLTNKLSYVVEVCAQVVHPQPLALRHHLCAEETSMWQLAGASRALRLSLAETA